VARPLCVDISVYQGVNIDWNAYVTWAKQWDGIARVIMRSSYGSGGLRDADFEAHWSGAVAAGCNIIGVYHYAYPDFNKGTQGATNEADSQFGIVGNRLRANDFVMLDWEEETPEATPAWAYTWLARQRSNFGGRLPRIYVDPSFAAAHCQDNRLAQFPLILADWTFDPNSNPAAPHPWTSYEFLQWSDRGTVPGIPGQVDMDVFVRQVTATALFAGTGGDGMALVQNPANEQRLDLVYVGTDGNLWHNWNNNDGLQGLAQDAPTHVETWGNPGTPFSPLTAAATWDAQGNYLNVVAATTDGALWAQVRNISGAKVAGWLRIVGQAVSLPSGTGGTQGPPGPAGPPGPPGPTYDDTAIKSRVSTLETLVSKIKAVFASS
jgi:lysozyme